MPVLRSLSLALLLAAIPAFALRDADHPAVDAVIAYGHAHVDASGLVTDTTGAPNLAESTGAYIVACFETGQDLEQARTMLGRLLDLQTAAGAAVGQFPWQVGTPPSDTAMLYLAPLLSHLYIHDAAALGPELQARLKTALEAISRALPKVSAGIQDDTRYLMRAAASAAVGAALGTKAPATAAAQAATWLRYLNTQGLPSGHSPTLDAVKYVALKWIHEYAPDNLRPGLDSALVLTAVDFAGRVHAAAEYPAGAITQAYVSDYTTATGFASYVLHTDFGHPLPATIEPYIMAAVLPSWHAPASVTALAAGDATGTRRTNSTRTEVTATDTYVGPTFSLGTLCGQVQTSTLPIFCTFSRCARPTLYFFCSPTPCTIQSLQVDGLAMCSFNFDGVGTREAVQASVKAVLGTPDDIDDVYAYGAHWNDLPTSLGERETVAIQTRGCYVGFTMMRTGIATSQEGSPGKPISLKWTQPNRRGDLVLTMYARQQEYALPRPQHNMRAGVVIEVVPESAYPSLADFVKHLSSGTLKQSVQSLTQRVPSAEKPRDPNVLIPQPRSKIEHVYRTTLEQTSEYAIAGRSLYLREDLLGNMTLERKVDDTPLDSTLLWESDFFKLPARQKLSEALKPFLTQ